MISDDAILYIVSSFALGVILILSRDRIPVPLRRPSAIVAIFLVAFAFALVVYSFASAGS